VITSPPAGTPIQREHDVDDADLRNDEPKLSSIPAYVPLSCRYRVMDFQDALTTRNAPPANRMVAAGDPSQNREGRAQGGKPGDGEQQPDAREHREAQAQKRSVLRLRQPVDENCQENDVVYRERSRERQVTKDSQVCGSEQSIIE
jgi:hypothetical protein